MPEKHEAVDEVAADETCAARDEDALALCAGELLDGWVARAGGERDGRGPAGDDVGRVAVGRDGGVAGVGGRRRRVGRRGAAGVEVERLELFARKKGSVSRGLDSCRKQERGRTRSSGTCSPWVPTSSMSLPSRSWTERVEGAREWALGARSSEGSWPRSESRWCGMAVARARSAGVGRREGEAGIQRSRGERGGVGGERLRVELGG